MYSLIDSLIGHTWVTGDSSQQYIFYICGSVILLLTAVTIDALYRVFLHFIRGGK